MGAFISEVINNYIIPKYYLAVFLVIAIIDFIGWWLKEAGKEAFGSRKTTIIVQVVLIVIGLIIGGGDE